MNRHTIKSELEMQRAINDHLEMVSKMDGIRILRHERKAKGEFVAHMIRCRNSKNNENLMGGMIVSHYWSLDQSGLLTRQFPMAVVSVDLPGYEDAIWQKLNIEMQILDVKR